MAMAMGATLCVTPGRRAATFPVPIRVAKLQISPGGRISSLRCTRDAGIHTSSSNPDGDTVDNVETEYIHPRYPFSNFYNPVDDRPWYIKFSDEVSTMTPVRGLKFIAAAAALYTAADFALKHLVLNQKLWMYASWTLVFWPWLASITLGATAASLAYKKHLKNWTLSPREEMVVLLGAVTWLTLVPMGLFQGFVDGYPVLMFGVYFVYSYMELGLRRWFFGVPYDAEVPKEWQLPRNVATWTGFVGSVVTGNWLAAFEAPPVMTTWNLGWQTLAGATMVTIALAFKYYGSYFLYKYFVEVNQPEKTVVFGPYRWVRHPMYGSTILLLLGSCLVLRAYGSLCLMLAGCLFYYEQVTKMEEELLVRQFGKEYEEYRDKVTKKYIPFVY